MMRALTLDNRSGLPGWEHSARVCLGPVGYWGDILVLADSSVKEDLVIFYELKVRPELFGLFEVEHGCLCDLQRGAEAPE